MKQEEKFLQEIGKRIEETSDEGDAPISGRDGRRLLAEIARLRAEIERIRSYTVSEACLCNPFPTLMHIGDVCTVALGGEPSPVGFLCQE
jgi:hypothetical protein